MDFIEVRAQDPNDTKTEFGLVFEERFLTENEMAQLLQAIELGEWVNDKENKRVQIFGYNYLDPTKEAIEIPAHFNQLREKIQARFGTYDQLIISEFLPGIGLKPHVDRFFWAESIIGISLLSSCIMELKGVCDPIQKLITLTPGSLYQLKGQSRYETCHSIPPESVTERRISLTFRNLAKEKVVMSVDTVSSLELKIKQIPVL